MGSPEQQAWTAEAARIAPDIARVQHDAGYG
jgi:hypothetical protein